MKRTLLPALCSLLFSGFASAGNLDQVSTLTQAEFKNLSTDLTAALSYKAVQPAAALGITGFDVGLGMGITDMKYSAVWDKASSGGDFGWLPVPKLQFVKGLPFNINVGGFYTKVPTTNIKLWGAELTYAVLPGGILTPAMAIRATFTKLSGVDQLDFNTKGLEVSVSKGFASATPFFGIGYVWADSNPNFAGLATETIGKLKYYGGLNFNVLTGNLAIEADKTGDNMTYSAKVGIRF